MFALVRPSYRDYQHAHQCFGTYWASGRAAAQGLNPYVAYPETFRGDYRDYGGSPSVPDLNLNPPFVLPILQFLSYLPIQSFSVLWAVIGFLAQITATAMLLWIRPEMQNRQICWLLCSAPVIDGLAFGQIYSVLGLLIAIAYVSKKLGHDTAAAICIGLVVAIKPTLAFWPVFLYLGGYRKNALQSGSVACLASLLPIPLYGLKIYREWFTALSPDVHWLAYDDIALIPTFSRHGHRQIGFAVAAALAIALGAWVSKRKPDFTSASGVALIAAIVCGPLAWFDYVSFVAPFFTARNWNWWGTLAAVLLGPLLMFKALGGGLYLAGTLLILGVFVAHTERAGVRILEQEEMQRSLTIA
jgi:hypothetical protein